MVNEGRKKSKGEGRSVCVMKAEGRTLQREEEDSQDAGRAVGKIREMYTDGRIYTCYGKNCFIC